MVISQNAVSRPERYQDARLEVEFTSVSASLDSRGIVLTRKEYELLAFLVQHAGETIPPRHSPGESLALQRKTPRANTGRSYSPRSEEVSAPTTADTSKRSSESVTVFNPFCKRPSPPDHSDRALQLESLLNMTSNLVCESCDCLCCRRKALVSILSATPPLSWRRGILRPDDGDAVCPPLGDKKQIPTSESSLH
jgi:hypothetical protein